MADEGKGLTLICNSRVSRSDWYIYCFVWIMLAVGYVYVEYRLSRSVSACCEL